MVFEFEFTGIMPLIMHHDSIEGADMVAEWINSPEGKKLSVKGDDRRPAWKWMYSLYPGEEHVVIPFDVLMGAIRMGASKVSIDSGGKRRKSYEELSQSGLLIHEEETVLYTPDHPVRMADVEKLRNLPFAEMAQRVKKFGFTLYVKPVRVGRDKARHIRVRPRFDHWKTRGHIEITDPLITPEALKAILDASGRYGGLCDRRPGARYPQKPGPFGTYGVRLKQVK
jgi:hypothetical protein